MDGVRIGIIGDYDPEYPIHRTTNAALEAAGRRVEASVVYEWIGTDSIEQGDPPGRLAAYDGFWAAPGGPYRSLNGDLAGIRFARERGIPFVGT